MDKIGLTPEGFTRAGKFQGHAPARNASREDIPPEERQMVQHLIDETYARFKQVVQDGPLAGRTRRYKSKRRQRPRALAGRLGEICRWPRALGQGSL